MNDIPTPITDAETMKAEWDHVDSEFGPFSPSTTVSADFARDLERQLADVTEQRYRLYESLSLVWKHLRGERIRHDYVTLDNQTLQQVVKTALAAVKGGQHE